MSEKPFQSIPAAKPIPVAFGQFVPPNHIEAEQAVLGAMLIERPAVDLVLAILAKEDFYRETHQMIFDVVVSLVEKSEPVDIVTVPHELSERGQLLVVSMPYILALFDTVPTAASAEFYARSVLHHAVRRRICAAGVQLLGIGQAESETPEEAVGEAEQCVMAIGDSQRRGEAAASSIGSLLAGHYDRSEAMSERGGKMLGLSTGLLGIDRLTSGLQAPDFLVLAGRPGCGKTSLLLHMALHVAVRLHRPVVLFSLEMSKEQLAARVACMIAGVDYFRFQLGNLSETEWERCADAVRLCYTAPLIIDDTPGISPGEMASTLRRVRREKGDLAFVGVDYLQLMSPHSPLSTPRGSRDENRTQAVSALSRDLKKLARTERIPLMALSQLSRAVESRENKRPMLSDLRESGQIEADADLVAFLYNEQYYARMRTPGAEVVPGTVDEVEFAVAKHRNGPTGTIKIGFQPTYTRFADIAYRDDAPTGV